MTSLLTSCHIQHVSWHYKSVCSLPINFYEWVKYPTTTSSQRTNGHQTHQTSTHSTTMCGVWCISQTSVKAKNHSRAKMHCSRSWMTCHRQRSTKRIKLSTTFANVWTRAFRPMTDIMSIMMWTRWSCLIWHNFVTGGDNWIQESWATAKMTARCTLYVWVHWKISGVPDYTPTATFRKICWLLFRLSL